jgi:hypothetical protein
MTRKTLEIWEAVSPSACYVTVTDARGRDIERPVGGPGNPQRIRLSEEDRLLNEEANLDGGPFVNGMLRRVDGAHAGDDSQPAKTNAQLLGLLQNAEDLEEILMDESELNVRRLLVLAEGEAGGRVSMSTHAIIRATVERRWPQAEPPALQRRAAVTELFAL